MNLLRLAVVFLLIPTYAPAEDVYRIQSLSEREVLQTYNRLLVNAVHYSDQFWRSSAFDPDAGYWGDGVSEGNQGIRAVGEMVFVCGTLLKYSDALSEAERIAYLSKTKSAIRFACATHTTGTQKCPDGKSWGGSWQSAMWARTLGFGAWLIWDKLPSTRRA